MSNTQENKETNKPNPNSAVTEKVEREIHRALQDLAYGSVEIIVHDGRVVQIERKEKVRFN